MDVTDAAAVDHWVQEAATELGPVNLVVVNAGVSDPRTLMLSEPAQWRRLMSINLDGAMHLARRNAPPRSRTCRCASATADTSRMATTRADAGTSPRLCWQSHSGTTTAAIRLTSTWK